MRQLIIVNKNTKSMDRYIQDINSTNVLTSEEEVLLVQQIRMGDREALERLINANLRYVVGVAKRFQKRGLSLPDLIIEGNLGLMRAAEHFDETSGFKFINYAFWYIRQSMIQAIVENFIIVPLPLNKIGLISKMNNALALIEQYFQRKPSANEIDGMLKFQSNVVREVFQESNNRTFAEAVSA